MMMSQLKNVEWMEQGIKLQNLSYLCCNRDNANAYILLSESLPVTAM